MRTTKTGTGGLWGGVFGGVWGGVLGWLRSGWRYLGAILGEQDYDKYVAYLRAHHPDAPIPTVAEYWRMRFSDQERNPSGRCC